MRRFPIAFIALLIVAAATLGLTYSGNGGVWVMIRGTFNSKNEPGTDTGIQTAMDESDGGRVQVGAGRYTINGTLRFRDAGMEVYGAGDSTVWVNNSGTGDTIAVIDQPNITIRDMRFEGLLPTKQEGVGIYVNAPGVKIERVRFKSMPQTAIKLGPNASGFTIKDCAIDGTGDADADTACGIWVFNANGGSITGNEIQNTRSHGIYLSAGAKNIKIEGNRVLGTVNGSANGDGIRADSTSFGVLIADNIVRNVKGDGIECSADSSQVVGNEILSCTNGVHTHYGGRFITYKDNYIANSQTYGIYMEFVGTGIWGVHIVGNTVVNPGANCIHLESQLTESGDCLVEGNYFYGGINAALSSVRCLSVGSGNWHRLTIRNNRIFQPKRSGIQFLWGSGYGYFKDCVVENNVIFSPGQYGVETLTRLSAPQSTVRISGNTVINPGTAELGLVQDGTFAYEGQGKNTTRASTVIAEDSLRVGKTAKFGVYTAATLPPVQNGLMVYCDDCTKTTPCGSGGGGAFAFGVGSSWDCMAPGGGGGGGDSTNLGYLPGRPNGQVLFGSSSTTTGANTYLGLKGFNASTAALIKLNTQTDVTGVATISDTLRIANNLDISSGDIRMKNNRALMGRLSTGNTLVPIAKIDSTNTLRIHAQTGGNIDFFKTDGTLNVRMYGAGETSFSNPIQMGGFRILKDADPDRYIVNRNASGGIAFRPLADDRTNFYVKNGGAAWGAQSITAKDTLVAEGLLHAKTRVLVADSIHVTKRAVFDLGYEVLGNSWVKGRIIAGDSLRVNGRAAFDDSLMVRLGAWIAGRTTVRDSLRVNGAARFDAGVFTTGDSWDANSRTIRDSLRVIGPLRVGRLSGVPDRSSFGEGGVAVAESTTLVLNGPDAGGTAYSPKVYFNRNGTTVGQMSFNGVNWAFRLDPAANKFWRFGTLGSETGSYVACLKNDGSLELGTGTPNYKLEVNGDAYMQDSLNAAGGIKIGGTNKVKKFIPAYGTLDFDLTSQTVQDLTITATGAAVGDVVKLGVPNGAVTTTAIYFAWVSAANTVTVRCRTNAAGENPASGLFTVVVEQYL